MLSNWKTHTVMLAAVGIVLIGTLATAGLVMAHDHKKGERDRYEEETEIEIRMAAGAGFSQARGTVTWSEDHDDGYKELEIDIEYLPEADYTVFVAGEQKGVIQARPDGDNDGAEGELEFYSDGRDSAPLLDFDPFGQLIEVKSGDEVVLSVTMPEQQAIQMRGGNDRGGRYEGRGDRERNDNDGRGRRAEEHRSYAHERWVINLANTGVYPSARAMLEFVVDEDGRELDVEVDDLPIGSYTLRVDGQDRGTLMVSADSSRGGNARSDDTEGELGFSEEMDEEDNFPLDFEVKGAEFAILEGERVLFQGRLE